jgi:hypothetical protein
MADSKDQSATRTLKLDDLWDALNDPEADEMPPHPRNQYEIAEGIVTGMKPPTIGLQEKFNEAFEPVQELIVLPEGSEGGLVDLADIRLREGVTTNDFQEALAGAAARQAKLVLRGAEDVPTGDIFAPMALVVQDHFTRLCRGIGARRNGLSAATKTAA